MDKDPNRVLLMILDMQKIYTKYFDQANKANNQRNHIQIYALRLKLDFHISNKKNEQIITLPYKQVKKLK